MMINNCLKIKWEIGDKVKSNGMFNEHNWMGIFGIVTNVEDDFLHGQTVTINGGAFKIGRYNLEAY